jgi:hypothetical protein|tara:strand:- start:1756 stop:2013 length:258 start_codon:yes stop_codon:yes gene_type:complete
MALTYSIINIADLDKVDFSQVNEDSQNTIRKNLLDPVTQFLLKWDSEPTFIADGTIVPVAQYTHNECMAILATSEWSTVSPSEDE